MSEVETVLPCQVMSVDSTLSLETIHLTVQNRLFSWKHVSPTSPASIDL